MIISQKLILSLLVSAMASGLSLINQKPVHASTTFCNKTNFTVLVAYARAEIVIGYGDVGIATSDASTDYTVSGWWWLAPNECVLPDAATGPATKYTQDATTYAVYHYFFAKAVDENNYWIDDVYWAGNNVLCVTDSAFERTQSIGGYTTEENLAAQIQCPTNYYQAGFQKINSNTTDWTVNLTSNSNNSISPTPIDGDPPVCSKKPSLPQC